VITVKPASQDGSTDERKDGRVDVRKDVCVDGHVDVFTHTLSDTSKATATVGGRRRGCVIALANHKGGVTKTTSTANLGAMLAEQGLRVLIVDCDPQANLSELFGWTEDLPGERLEDLLANPDAAGRYVPPVAVMADIEPRPPWREWLSIIPCTDVLADVVADLPVSAGKGYETRLKTVIDAQRERFDVILLDTPPGLGNLPGMAMLAADRLLIPALAADLDVRGAGKLYDLVADQLPDLEIIGVLVAASERRWRITRELAERMGADQMRVLPTHIPRAVRVASAPRYRAPTAVLEPESMVSHAYRQLARQILEELRS
jgi:chromosome partitioning protein